MTDTVLLALTLALGIFTPAAEAHGYVQGIVADGVYYQGYRPSFQYQQPPPQVPGWSDPLNINNGFINDYTSPDIICHLNATAGRAYAAVQAGGSVELQWTNWPIGHLGPVITYLANCNGNCSTVDKTKLLFNKIDQAGLIQGGSSPGRWAADELVANNNSWTVQIPTDIAPGQYVLRHEIISLQEAMVYGGAQNYPQCVNLVVTGSGTNQLQTGTVGTSLYTRDDPGLHIDIYRSLSNYTIPGPALLSGVSNSTQPVLNTSAVVGASTSTTLRSTSATVTATTFATSSTAVGQGFYTVTSTTSVNSTSTTTGTATISNTSSTTSSTTSNTSSSTLSMSSGTVSTSSGTVSTTSGSSSSILSSITSTTTLNPTSSTTSNILSTSTSTITVTTTMTSSMVSSSSLSTSSSITVSPLSLFPTTLQTVTRSNTSTSLNSTEVSTTYVIITVTVGGTFADLSTSAVTTTTTTTQEPFYPYTNGTGPQNGYGSGYGSGTGTGAAWATGTGMVWSTGTLSSFYPFGTGYSTTSTTATSIPSPVYVAYRPRRVVRSVRRSNQQS